MTRGLYIHIPFCAGRCGYCAFFSVPYDSRMAERYLAALEKDLSRADLNPETIYVGGGTPTILSTPQLERLCKAIVRSVALERIVEWTFEANPVSLTADKLDILVSAGVNRISLGAQSFDEQALALLGRRHGSIDTRRCAADIRAAGIANLNIDLIACVPGIGRVSWENSVRQAVELEPEHVSIYALTQEEGTILSRAARNGAVVMPADEEQLEALGSAESLLVKAGYLHYEISNYARPGFECLHNLSCWRGGEYAGLGPSASSHAGLDRHTNAPDIGRYIEAVETGEVIPGERETLTPELKRTERLIFGLRLSEGVDSALAAGRRTVLETLRRSGLVAFGNERWTLTRRGRDLADYVGSELMW